MMLIVYRRDSLKKVNDAFAKIVRIGCLDVDMHDELVEFVEKNGAIDADRQCGR